MRANHNTGINILVAWSIAFLLLFIYYRYVEFPMERSFARGVRLMRQHNDSKAVNEFKQVLRFYPSYEPVYLNLADYYHKIGEHDAAWGAFRHARWINNMNAEYTLIHRSWGIFYASASEGSFGYSFLDEQLPLYNNRVVENYFSSLLYSYERK